MTFKEKFRSCNTWQEKAAVVNLCHWLLISKRNGKWNLRATARYLEVSLGYVSESMKLARNLDVVKGQPTRKAALIQLK